MDPKLTVHFTTTLARDEVVAVLLFCASHTDMRKVCNPLGALVGVVASEQRLAELLAEVPRLRVQYEVVA